MGGVLTGGREACVACSSNFKPLARLVAKISTEKSFPIVTVSQGPTIGFRCEPAVKYIQPFLCSESLNFNKIQILRVNINIYM